MVEKKPGESSKVEEETPEDGKSPTVELTIISSEKPQTMYGTTNQFMFAKKMKVDRNMTTK